MHSLTRSISGEIVDKAVELKKEQPLRSDDCINRFLAEYYGKTIFKSTLLKPFLSQIPQIQFLPIYVHFTHVSSSSLLALIVFGLGEIQKHTKDRLFLQIMDKTALQKITPILLIDEAHLLKTDAITDLRLLVSSPLDSSAPLKIILSGQEYLKYILPRYQIST